MKMHHRAAHRALQLLFLSALLAPLSPALAQRAVLAFAEQPAKLIRKTTVHEAPAGARLQSGDIVETDKRWLQLEWPGDAILALGPASSVLLGDAGGAPTVSLLRGWLKVSAGQRAARPLTIQAGGLELRTGGEGGSGVLHLSADQVELFVEQGTLAVTDREKSASAVTVNREHYAQRGGGLALRVAQRPPPAFIAAMPRSFFDTLVAVANRAVPAAVKPLREAGAADLAEWTNLAPMLSRQLVTQFSARLADPLFAGDAETMLAANPHWRQAIQQATSVRRRQNTISNVLF
ncbi:hypothetical protein GTP38_15570 [Duganella sp. FT94W]|uniref:FecR protein domain-containing protein n=1 Tax=Duganella lactea TaxID=2692173 RepID=A0ABW9VAR7_9BURK|nr:hypothetical protein [Duganella lactea]MYM35753.1 hypothetical protein [Duganella lactea]